MNAIVADKLSVDMRCELCPARHHAVCRALHGLDFHLLTDIMSHRHYQRGDIIWEEGSEAQFVAIVVSGVADLSKLLPDGREHIVGLLFSSDWLGQPFSRHNTTTAKAVTDVQLCCFPRGRFEHILGAQPQLEHELFTRSLSDLDDTRNWLVTLTRKSAGQRVADFLLTLAERLQVDHCPRATTPDRQTISLPLTRSETANYLGLTIETVSRCFTKLKVAGLIAIEGSRDITILDHEALARFAEPDD